MFKKGLILVSFLTYIAFAQNKEMRFNLNKEKNSETHNRKISRSEFLIKQQELNLKEIDEKMNKKDMLLKDGEELQLATFAGGCFWCMEPPFDNEKGVYKTISGYGGGEEKNPTYEQVSSGKTGHLEVMQVHYNPKIVTYKRLLEIFWEQIDPTDDGGQFVDRGSQYKSAIFYHNEEQKKLIDESLEELKAKKIFDKPIVTKILPFVSFYSAEDYHQDYYQKNPVRYKFYRYSSGRDQFLNNKWHKDE